MAKNKITDLRNHLFETIEMLKDGDEKETGMTVSKAKAIANVAQVIINSAKLEIEYVKVRDMIGETRPMTNFLIEEKEPEKK